MIILSAFLTSLARILRTNYLVDNANLTWDRAMYIYSIAISMGLFLFIPVLFFLGIKPNFSINKINGLIANITQIVVIYIANALYFRSFFEIKKRNKDEKLFVPFVIVYTLPTICAALIYTILGIEKYNLKDYFYIFMILSGNIGLARYWNE